MEIKAVIIEDEAIGRATLRSYLAKYCPQVELLGEAENIIEGRKLIDQTKPNLVFLDIEMPVMDGYSATKAIRKLNNANKNIPIVALTASALIDERKKALACGMNDYLSKPFTPDQLREVAENLIVKQPEISLEIEDTNRPRLVKEINGVELSPFNTIVNLSIGERNL